MGKEIKWAKDLDRHFSKEDIQMVNKNMKRCSASLRDMQIKTMTRYHFTPARMVIIEKTRDKYWKVLEEKGTLCTIGGNVNWCSHYGNQ